MQEQHESRHAWQKLILPAVLGIVAAVCYYRAVAAQVTPSIFVRVKRPIAKGEIIRQADLQSLSLRGETESFRQTALTWMQAGRAIGARASRQIYSGDVLLLSDVEIDDQIYPIPKGEEPREILISDQQSVAISVPDDLELGSQVRAYITKKGESEQQIVGPFRVVKMVKSHREDRSADTRQLVKIVLSVPRAGDDQADPQMASLNAFLFDPETRKVEFVPYRPDLEEAS